jgi:hypothetical protein
MKIAQPASESSQHRVDHARQAGDAPRVGQPTTVPLAAPPRAGGRSAALLLGIGVLLAAVFILDVLTPLGVAVWLLYLGPLVLAFRSTDRRLAVAVAGRHYMLTTAHDLTERKRGSGAPARERRFAALFEKSAVPTARHEMPGGTFSRNGGDRHQPSAPFP